MTTIDPSSTLREIVDIGNGIMERNGCTERDLLSLVTTPLLLNLGWTGHELFFERPENSQTPDITIIPTGNKGLPTITIEAKAPNKDIGSFHYGWQSRMRFAAKDRYETPLQQTYNQLVSIARSDGPKLGLLTNGRKYTFLMVESHDTELIKCYGYFEAREILGNRETFLHFAKYLSKSTYLETAHSDATAEPARCFEASASTNSRLPSDWYLQFTQWAESLSTSRLKGDSVFKSYIKRVNGAEPYAKAVAIYESMRFFAALDAMLPMNWRMEFYEKDNVNMHLTPPWKDQDRRNSKSSWILQVSPFGDTMGVIWVRAARQDFPRDNEVYEVRNSFKAWLGKTPKIQEEGMPERTIEGLRRASQQLFDAALIASPIPSV